MSETPQHVSLESEFRAAVPPQQAPLAQRTWWRLILRLLKLRPVQQYIEKKFRA
jgi:hypothetical protein